MRNRFADKVALVTGGDTGIGPATASVFAREGAMVVVAGRRYEPLQETVSQIRADGGTADAMQVDTTSEEQLARLVDTINTRHGALHIACNNAGVPETPSHAYDLDRWRRTVDTNLQGVWLSMKHEIGYMRTNSGGSIVNVASMAGAVRYYCAALHAASKDGVIGLTRTAAIDHGTEGVRVNAVCPGPVQTTMLAQAKASRGLAAEEFDLSRIPMGRLGRPVEVANAVVWLASDEAAYVTGQALAVDGGWTAQ